MDQPASEAEKHRLIGGALCLDFANTLNGHRKGHYHEYLQTYRDLIVWSRKAGILTEEEGSRLLREAARRPGSAAAAIERARALRESIYRIFVSISEDMPIRPSDLAALNGARTEALAHSRIAPSGAGFRREWTEDKALDRMLWPIVLSAADLLVSKGVERVRGCAGDICDWLFVDTSRNHMRRWCSMDECGNLAKARRFKERRAMRKRLNSGRSRPQSA